MYQWKPNGVSLTFDNWAPGFPTGQECVSLNLNSPHHGLWQDVPCRGSDEAAILFGVCEVASCVQRPCDIHASPDHSNPSPTMCVDCVCDPGKDCPGSQNYLGLWQLAQIVLAPQNIDLLGTAGNRDMLNIYVRKVS